MMSDQVDPERVRAIAEAARIPLSEDAQRRVARAVTPPVTRFAAANLALPLEAEPSTFLIAQRGELKR
jgi:hypothetical protein